MGLPVWLTPRLRGWCVVQLCLLGTATWQGWYGISLLGLGLLGCVLALYHRSAKRHHLQAVHEDIQDRLLALYRAEQTAAQQTRWQPNAYPTAQAQTAQFKRLIVIDLWTGYTRWR